MYGLAGIARRISTSTVKLKVLGSNPGRYLEILPVLTSLPEKSTQNYSKYQQVKPRFTTTSRAKFKKKLIAYNFCKKSEKIPIQSSP